MSARMNSAWAQSTWLIQRNSTAASTLGCRSHLCVPSLQRYLAVYEELYYLSLVRASFTVTCTPPESYTNHTWYLITRVKYVTPAGDEV